MEAQDLTRIKGYVSAIAPKFGSEASLDVFVEMADSCVDRGFFGDMYWQAVAYLTCHRMELAARGGDASGAVTSRREGDISVGYAAPGGDSEYLLTSYGRMYLEIERRKSPGFLLTGGCATIISWGNC